MTMITTLYVAVLVVLVVLLFVIAFLARPEDQKNERRVWIVLALLMGWLAVGSMGWSAMVTARNRTMISESLQTKGKVIKMGRDVKRTRAPVIRYQVNGKSYDFQAGTSSHPPAYSAGDTVVVRYRPGRPGEGYLVSFDELWLPPLTFTGVGIFCGAWSALILWNARRPNWPNVKRPIRPDSAPQWDV
jgi:4-amino-4-deoxy-L-arabinose transferase-like glycosyltransferase